MSHNGNLNRGKVDAKPEAGTRQPKGKSSECDAVLRTGLQPKPEAVTTIDPDANKGAAIAAGLRQRVDDNGNEDSNPKHRKVNSWGISNKK